VDLQPGRNLLHYRLVDKIGEGGMGVVWKAVDTTLDREVAIKLLPEWGQSPGGQSTSPDERLARFEREAKLLASLNHPNIAAVYGLHETGDATSPVRFIAMELVGGEDLAARLARGPLPLRDALVIARQVAGALAAAHDSGVIHRDLKPANIRLTPDGKVKVLDFGLAKAFEPATASGSADPSLSPTLTSAGTRAGVILGTAAYMSPEQARGKAVDKRADIWAFGCVSYEMLAGRETFGGDTVTDVLAAILKTEPDLSVLAGAVPRRILRLLQRCLEKDLSKRLRDAGDIGLEIDEVLAGDLTAAGAAERAASAKGTWGRLALVAAGALILGAALGWLTNVGGRRSSGPGELQRMTVTAGEGRAIRDASISRNGRLLVLVLDDGAYLRPLDSYELQPVPDSERLGSWAESPDGQSIIFFTVDDQIMGSGKLRRTSLATGETVTVRDSSESLFPVLWREDGVLAFRNNGKKILRLSVETAEPESLFELNESHLHGGSAIPGTSAILVDVHEDGGKAEWTLSAVDLETRELQPVAANARAGVVTADGHLLFLREGTLIASAFDLTTLEPTGLQVPILSGVRSFSISDNGTLAYLPADEDAEVKRLVRIDRDGKTEVLTEGDLRHIRYAPNGRWISAGLREAINLVDRRSGSVRPLLNEGFRFSDQVWRADSKAVIYTAYSSDGSRCVLFEHPLDGSAPKILLETEAKQAEIFPTGYAPDGSGLIFARYEDDDADLWWLPADGSEARPLLASKASEDLARFSPDGRWVAYESNETGRQEVWVAGYRAAAGQLAEKWQISREGGKDPIWSPDGRELYYENFDGQLVVIAVGAAADDPESLTFGQHSVLFDLRQLNMASEGDESYDAAPSGDHLILIQQGSGGTTEVRVVLNWFEELRRVVPAGG
jgi:serine/threonine-protein kinase